MNLDNVLSTIEANAAKVLADKLDAARNTAEGLQKLRDAGLTNLEINATNYDWCNIWVNPDNDDRNWFKNTKRDRRQLTNKLNAFRKALGCPLKLYHKNLYDSKNRLISVTLQVEAHPHIRIQYRKKLKSGGKCQIKRTKSTSAQLVCSID